MGQISARRWLMGVLPVLAVGCSSSETPPPPPGACGSDDIGCVLSQLRLSGPEGDVPLVSVPASAAPYLPPAASAPSGRVTDGGSTDVGAASSDVELWGTFNGSGPNIRTGFVAHRRGSTWTQWVAPFAGERTLHGIWGSAASDVWVVSEAFDGHAIWHWDGSAWAPAPLSTTETSLHFRAVWGSGPDDVWAGGDGILAHFDGQTWSVAGGTQAIGGTSYSITGLWGSGPSDVWAVGEEDINSGGGAWHWNGSVWSSAYPMDGRDPAVWGSGPSDIWVVGGSSSSNHWDGSGWTSVPTGSLNGVWGSSARDVWAVGSPTTILHWSGSSWAPGNANGLADYLRGALFATSKDVWIGEASMGSESSSIRHFSGTTWTSEVSYDNAGIAAIWGVRGGSSSGAADGGAADAPGGPPTVSSRIDLVTLRGKGAAPLDLDWKDPNGCQPSFFMTLTRPGHVGTIPWGWRATHVIPDGLMSGHTRYTVTLPVEITGAGSDLDLWIVPVSDPRWRDPANLQARDFLAGPAAHVRARIEPSASPADAGSPTNPGTGGSAGRGGSGGTGTGGAAGAGDGGAGGAGGAGGTGTGGDVGTGGTGAGGTDVGGAAGTGTDGGGGNVCCACTFDVTCTAFGAGGCWYCSGSVYLSGVCQAQASALTSPGACVCDPGLYQICR